MYIKRKKVRKLLHNLGWALFWIIAIPVVLAHFAVPLFYPAETSGLAMRAFLSREPLPPLPAEATLHKSSPLQKLAGTS